MIVSMWMTRDVVTIQPQTPVIQAAELMARRHIRRLPVVETVSDGQQVADIVSARDILHAFPPNVNPFAVIAPTPGETPVAVGHIMTHQVQTVAPEAPIEAAAKLMAEQKLEHCPWFGMAGWSD